MLRNATLEWIEGLPKGFCFSYQDAYRNLETTFPTECKESGSQRRGQINVPAYWRCAGFAIWDARHKYGLIKHTGVRGQRIRI